METVISVGVAVHKGGTHDQGEHTKGVNLSFLLLHERSRLPLARQK